MILNNEKHEYETHDATFFPFRMKIGYYINEIKIESGINRGP